MAPPMYLIANQELFNYNTTHFIESASKPVSSVNLDLNNEMKKVAFILKDVLMFK